MSQYHDVPNNKKNTDPGHGYFAQLASFEKEHCEKGELYMEYRKLPCQEINGEVCEYCRATDFVSPSSAAPICLKMSLHCITTDLSVFSNSLLLNFHISDSAFAIFSKRAFAFS